MRSHPYAKAPAYQRWSRAITNTATQDVDPVVSASFTIGRTDKVSTAGSCFAQHIARRLAGEGFSYFVAEPAHPIIPADMAKAWNYGVFSCRFGNVYTARQLVQLFERAYGRFVPADDYWEKDGVFIDPLRPTIQPDGFTSLAELHEDRAQHLAAVRRMFEETSVFVFTLGLTEYWFDKVDGAAYPICPGVAGGEFDPDRHQFANQNVAEVVEDLKTFIAGLRAVNPGIRIILTVSPVALAATAVNRHVLVSTTYSKSVLRVAAEQISNEHEAIAYFPSYEVIVGSYNHGAYYASDMRDVVEDGVDHVMRLFFKHYAPEAEIQPVEEGESTAQASADAARASRIERMVQAICEEKLLDV